MTLKDIAKQLTTAVQTVPNLVQILRDGLEQATAGSTVEVTQVVSSGTKIASVTVDDETTDLYAPEAIGGLDYSATEQDTGLKWIDESAIYQKTIHTEALTNNTNKTVAHGITDFGCIIKIEGYAITSSNTMTFPIIARNEFVAVYVDSTDISINVVGDWSSVTDSYITLFYTKAEA